VPGYRPGQRWLFRVRRDPTYRRRQRPDPEAPSDGSLRLATRHSMRIKASTVATEAAPALSWRAHRNAFLADGSHETPPGLRGSRKNAYRVFRARTVGICARCWFPTPPLSLEAIVRWRTHLADGRGIKKAICRGTPSAMPMGKAFLDPETTVRGTRISRIKQRLAWTLMKKTSLHLPSSHPLTHTHTHTLKKSIRIRHDTDRRDTKARR
jgi:hypothetical protein